LKKLEKIFEWVYVIISQWFSLWGESIPAMMLINQSMPSIHY
jgi:hypothetical protein